MNGTTRICRMAAYVLSVAMLTMAAATAPAEPGGLFAVEEGQHPGLESAVTTMRPVPGRDGAFFSAGRDGCVTFWQDGAVRSYHSGGGLPVAAIAAHPGGRDVALLETDGVAVHRVAVIDWETSACRYTKQFNDTVLNISYSPRGTYLFITTGGIHGAYILDAATGRLIHQLTDVSGRVTLIHAGDSEKFAILYAQGGHIWYYDLIGYARVPRAQYETEADLEQVCVFGAGKMKNRFIAGTKADTVYIVDARNGAVLLREPAPAPVFVQEDTETSGSLSFITVSNGVPLLRRVTGDALSRRLEGGAAVVSEAIRIPDGLTSGDYYTAAAQSSRLLVLGTAYGAVYRQDMTVTGGSVSSWRTDATVAVHDIGSDGVWLYLLTEDALYRGGNETLTPVGLNPSGHTNFLLYGDGAVLWSMGMDRPVEFLRSGAQTRMLFTPSAPVRRIRTAGGALISVEGDSPGAVWLYAMDTGARTCIYEGYAVQDAILMDRTTAYIAKAGTGSADSPLVAVNVRTAESVLLPLDGIYAYSLCHDAAAAAIYGLVVRSRSGYDATEAFVMRHDGTSATLLTCNSGDADSFTTLHDGTLFTSLGGNQLHALDLASGKRHAYRRTDAAIIGAVPLGGRVVALSSDGLVVWYDRDTRAAQTVWHVLPGGRLDIQ